jgi:hypothetical protein
VPTPSSAAQDKENMVRRIASNTKTAGDVSGS